MTSRVTRFLPSQEAAEDACVEAAANTVLGNTAHNIVVQPAGGLLSLPPEIRLQICSYITLSPEFPDSVANRGILGACCQLQLDMFEEHGPAKDLNAFMAAPGRPWVDSPCTHLAVALGPPLPFLRFTRNVTLHLPRALLSPYSELRRGRQSALPRECICESTLEHLCGLYLDRLQVLFEDGSPQREDAQDDEEYLTVKSLQPYLFQNYVQAGKVNCRTVTFTVQRLAEAEGGRDKSTTLDMADEKTGIAYTMTIVQDKEERQVERGFSSETRFKTSALQTTPGY
ncbi:hypothetical protein DE146DRAFT_638378 [Phaeosphaeria sp. MPI-PUGE-AT-0046c]|nr:hypothetical protein DE146DRAFT_638378 [Phaeosphaeria sp. MPI-PUGE-AT-0046c]